MRKRQAKIGMTMQNIAAYGLVELQNKIAGGKPLGLSTSDLVQMLDTGGKMERAARGEEHTSSFTKINGIRPIDEEPELESESEAKTVEGETVRAAKSTASAPKRIC
jgi:hypothetical protein